jgi:uncharacterized protein
MKVIKSYSLESEADLGSRWRAQIKLRDMTTALRRAAPAFAFILAIIAAGHAPAQQPASIECRDVQFASQGVTLRGTIFVPQHSPIVAAAVWVDGAGRTERKRNLGNYFGHFGLALLTYDKRGVGESGGVYAGPEVGTNNVSLRNLTLLADDAAAAFQALRVEKQLRGVPLGFIGASQAGWIVPMAALKSPQARFMVLWSGAVETTHEDVLFEQLALNNPDFWHLHTHDQVRAMMAAKADTLEWANFDPRAALSKLKIPGLWMFGGRDRNMDVDISIDRLNGLIASGHRNYQYRLFPTYDHQLGHEDLDVMGPTVEWIRSAVAKSDR